MTGENLRLSVVIPNYNYGSFVGQAIESALAVDWPNTEVIVVDDGSTDDSRAKIESFGDRIKMLFQSNAGQIHACNLGYAQSSGDIVIFLDSDDMLDPSIMREIEKVWRPGISKIQVQMKAIDAVGRLLGTVFPQYHVPPTPERIRRWVAAAALHPRPPGSGNAYARTFLQRLFPLDTSCGYSSDSCCLVAAPYLGDVVTIAKPLVSYRIHGRNDGAVAKITPEKFRRPVVEAQQRFAYARRIAATVGIDVPEHVFRKNLSVMQYRTASFRVDRSNHPIEGDTSWRIAIDTVHAAATPQGRGVKEAWAIAVWVCFVLILPPSLARSVILWRFSPASRPAGLRMLLRGTGVLQ